MKKILAILLAAAVALTLWACGGSKDKSPQEQTTAPSESTTPSETTEPSKTTEPSETTPPSLPIQGTTEQHSLCGLTFTLIGAYEPFGDGKYSASYQGENISVEVSFGPMPEEDITTSAAFARYYYEELGIAFEESFAQTDLRSQGDVHYILCRGGEAVQTMVLGFYVSGDVCWMIGVNGYEPDLDVEAMITMATSGIIDESAVPDAPAQPEPEPTEHTLAGLTFRLDTSFRVDFEESAAAAYRSDTIFVEAEMETPSEQDMEIRDVSAYAAFYGAALGVAVEQTNGVPYVCYEEEEFGQTVAVGFYFVNGRGWKLSAMADDPALRDRLIQLVTGGTVDESAMPELPAAGNTVSFRGLTLTLEGEAIPTNATEDALAFLYGDLGFTLTAGTMADLDAVPADSAALAEQLQGLYESLWDTISVESQSGTSYVLARDRDGFTMVVACYVSGESWWTVEVMDYLEDPTTAITAAVSGSVDNRLAE